LDNSIGINCRLSLSDVGKSDPKKFKEFSSPLIGEGISIYTDGSKTEDSPVGAAVYSPELGLALKHKLSADASIFSAEAWAVY